MSFFSLKIPLRKDCTLPIQTEGACFCQPMSWNMAAMLRDSTTVAVVVVVVVVVVVRTRPRAIPLAMIHMRKSTHGFPFVPLYGYGAPLGGLRPPELRYKHTSLFNFFRRSADMLLTSIKACLICSLRKGVYKCLLKIT